MKEKITVGPKQPESKDEQIILKVIEKLGAGYREEWGRTILHDTLLDIKKLHGEDLTVETVRERVQSIIRASEEVLVNLEKVK